MRALLRISALGVAMTFMATGLWASDPMDGTWDLDVAASKYDPGPGPRSLTRVYETDGKTIKMTSTGIDAEGKPTTTEYAGAYDGKDYPLKGSPRIDTISMVRVDEYTGNTTTKKDGKVNSTSIRVISKDGKVMTITTTGNDERGVAFTNTLVFRKR